MKELTSHAQHLVELTRSMDGPNRGRRDRVRRDLVGVLTAGTTSAAASAALAETSIGVSAVTAGSAKGFLLSSGALSGVVTGVALGAVALVFAHFVPTPTSKTAASAAPLAHLTRPALATAVQPARSVDESLRRGATPPSIPSQRRAQAPSAAAPATLAEETRLLDETQVAMRSSDPGRALGLLDEYDRRFGTGALREEAQAARALALCGAGRLQEGRAVAASFARKFPGSPLFPRVQRSCKPNQ